VEEDAMRVVVVGATGNVGTSVLRALARDDAITSVVGIARRRPTLTFAKTTWVQADVTSDDLVGHLRGADAVVALAWLIQPTRDEAGLWRVNVEGSIRVFEAVAGAGVSTLVYASSIGAYSPGPPKAGHDVRVDESWPTDGVATSSYSRQKAYLERVLDAYEYRHPQVRVVRMRMGLVFKRDAATQIRRLFAGPLLPNRLLRSGALRLLPDIPNLRVQAVHSHDAGEAYRLALTRDVRGAFNLAADPVLDAGLVAGLLHARTVQVPAAAARPAAAASWRLRLQPLDPGWLDLGLQAPLMDSSRAREELGWIPEHSADSALLELLEGMRESAGMATAPLSPATSGRLRARELASGVGQRDGA
jgi:nucleoside-diphosphate-sugar epimerase